MPRREQHEAILAALGAAADVLAGSGVTLALEPLNTRVDHPGTYLDSTREGLDLVERVSRPEVRLLVDLYHGAVMGEVPQEVLAGRVGLIAHVHLADAPGRHEPGTGELPWRERVAWLRAQGYGGRIGLEYAPSGATRAALAWFAGGAEDAP